MQAISTQDFQSRGHVLANKNPHSLHFQGNLQSLCSNFPRMWRLIVLFVSQFGAYEAFARVWVTSIQRGAKIFFDTCGHFAKEYFCV